MKEENGEQNVVFEIFWTVYIARRFCIVVFVLMHNDRTVTRIEPVTNV